MTRRFDITLPFAPTDKVIELGGGDNPRFRPNVDIRPGPTVDFVCDLNEIPSESILAGSQYDGVFSQYALEHVSWRNVERFVRQAFLMLKPGGHAVFIIPNLIEQAKYVVAKEKAGEFGDNEVCCIFGDQNYEGADWRANSHTAGFSPWSINKLFRDAGFESVIVVPHPATDTDMVVEARKPQDTKEIKVQTTELQGDGNPSSNEAVAVNFTHDQRREAYGHDYFNGGGQYGGYAREGYWDYPVHRLTAAKIKAYNPKSVLEIGPARGYVLKQLEDSGIPCLGLEVSRHCWLTRVTDAVREFDVTQTPWPFEDKEFDFCFSNAVLEHIPAQYIPAIAAEMERVSVRGLHGISFEDDDDGFDKTHTTLRDAAWWATKLPIGQIVTDKEDLERGTIPPTDNDQKVKLNLGCFRTMFGHGWINIDVLDMTNLARHLGYNFAQADLTRPLPMPNNSVDLIFSSHMLEHITPEQGLNLLKDCYRVMRPGATMRLTLPDAARITDLYSHGALESVKDLFPQGNTLTGVQRLWTLLVSGHATAYDADSLIAALKKAGFTDVRQLSFRQGNKQILTETQESLPSVSLFVEAVKT